MIFTRPQNPQLVRTHPLASNMRAAYLFGDPGRYVVDYAGFQNLSNASTGVGPVTKVTGRTGIFGNGNLMTGSDLFLPGGTSICTQCTPGVSSTLELAAQVIRPLEVKVICFTRCGI